MSAPSARHTEARDLWAHIFGERRDFICIGSGKQGQIGKNDLTDVKTECFKFPEEADKAWRWAQAQSIARNVFFASHLLITTVPPEGKKTARNKVNASAVLALWADDDGATWPEHLRPTALVESSPGHRHAYLRLTHPIPTRASRATQQASGSGDRRRSERLRPDPVPARATNVLTHLVVSGG